MMSLISFLVRIVLAVLFVFAGSAHFIGLRKTFVAIVPRSLPQPEAIVSLTGVLEIVGGIGLLIPMTVHLTGIAFLIFLIAVFPANVVAARKHIPYSNPLWLRAFAQIILMGVIAWATLVAS